MKGFLNKQAPYVFIAPTLLLLTLFSIVPIMVALVISFTDMDLGGLANLDRVGFIGFDNYVEVVKDPVFLKAILNTLFYVAIGVPLVILFSLAIALLINLGTSRIFKAFRVVYYLPSVTNIVAV
ncbi:MAG: sugar transporter permease, partial [Paenibacillus sp.]|nr:sugar transporter permease [Paenibacillus sp.]